MIKINDFQIIENGDKLAINVETNIGSTITSILLWNNETFKDESQSISLNYKLEQINNKEIFIVNASEIQIDSFKDIYFIEVESDYENEEDECNTCGTPALGITYSLLSYYNCLLNYVLENKNSNCNDCNNSYINKTAITINLLIDSIEKGIETGYYSEAIDMLEELKKLCNLKNCTNCEKVNCSKCSKFKQQ
jgi:hypothetical protein